MQRLMLFPPKGEAAVTIPLPFPLGGITYSPDGGALYATAGLSAPGEPRRSGVLKIQFSPTRVSPVPGSEGFRFRSGAAVSQRQDKMVVAGRYWNGEKLACGVFELSFGAGGVRQVLESQDCDDAIKRTGISLSPDATKAVAIYRTSLELIDIASGASKIVGAGFHSAAWSPDGRWVAAVKEGGSGATVLLDASTFRQMRTLGSAKVIWSPDSRYLLASGWQMPCGPYGYSFEKVDIETGKRSTIDSSKCRVVGNDIGWVDAGIAPR